MKPPHFSRPLSIRFFARFRAMAASRGFTLVELLVVIAIIAILAMLVFQVTGKIRHSGQSSKCVGNLRQLHMVMTRFAGENNGDIPVHYVLAANSASGLTEDWVASLRANSGMDRNDFIKLLDCPNVQGYLPQNGTSCYSMSTNLQSHQTPEQWRKSFWKLNMIVDAPTKIVLGDGGINPAWGNTGSTSTELKHPSAAGAAWVRPDFRESGDRAHFLFADGHVDALKKESLTLEMFAPYAPTLGVTP